MLTKDGNAIFTGVVDIVEKLGEVTLLYVNTGKEDQPIVAKLDGEVNVEKGATVGLTAPVGNLHVFDEKGMAFKRRAA